MNVVGICFVLIVWCIIFTTAAATCGSPPTLFPENTEILK